MSIRTLVTIAIAVCLLAKDHCQAASLQCHVPGECVDADFVDVVAAETYNECLEACKQNDECQWLTFFGLTKACARQRDCPHIELLCQDCYSAESECGSKRSLDYPSGLSSGVTGTCDSLFLPPQFSPPAMRPDLVTTARSSTRTHQVLRSAWRLATRKKSATGTPSSRTFSFACCTPTAAPST